MTTIMKKQVFQEERVAIPIGLIPMGLQPLSYGILSKLAKSLEGIGKFVRPDCWSS